MSESNNYNPSDLVYSFLDGEASAAQRTVLFSAMANDSSLQDELQDALRIRTAALRESQMPVPPAALTQKLFAKAGFQAPGALPESETAVAPAPWFNGLNRFTVPILSAAAGAVVTALLMLAFYPFAPSNQNLTSITAPQSTVVGAIPQNTAPALTPDAPKTGSVRATRAPISSATQHVRVSSSASGTTGSPVATQTPVNSQTDARSLSTPPVGAEVPNGLSNSGQISREALPQVAQITPLTIQPPMAQFTSSPSEVTVYENPMSRFKNEPADHTGNFMVTIGGMTGVQLYPTRTWESGWNVPLNNFTIGGMYYVSDNQSFGLQAGEEMFPMYLENTSTGTFNLQPTLFWIGAAYRYTMNPVFSIAEMEIHPYAQGFLGGTSTGPIGKADLGLSWQINSRFNMSLGGEGTLLGYRIANGWASAEKLGLSYSLGINF